MVAPVPQAAPAATPPAEAVQPSFAEQLSAFGRDAWAHLMQLDAREAGLNFLLSAGVVLFALAAVVLLRRLFDHWLAKFANNAATEVPEAERRTPRAVSVTWVLIRLSVLGGALFAVAAVWGIDAWAWISAGFGARLARLVLILVLCVALVEVAGFVIRRLVDGFASRSRDGRRGAQLRTLGPLLAGSAQTVLVVVGLLTFLSELGVKVGPLLASAGVVGIAVGFGAQTLVKDFLTGLFLIAEDVVSVGDNVRVGEVSGTVEAMTLRTIRLRNQNGTLHILPYSEAQVIHNRTNLFSSHLFLIPISYDSDVDRALEIMQQVGDELAQDPVYGAGITKPFELLGVEELSESAVTLAGRITTRPQFKTKRTVAREFNLRVKKAFDSAGIVSPFTTVQVMPAETPQPPTDGGEPRSFEPPERPSI